MKVLRAAVSLVLVASLHAWAPAVAPALVDPREPDTAQKLVSVHHSTGQAWLEDGYGNLGIALRDNNYFVSDTNYGWGPDSIGDSTDVGHWWTWFRGPSAATYTAALLAENGQNCSYSRLTSEPAGTNTIVMLKSCFPNSNIEGSPSETATPIESNPLKGNSSPLTVGNAKGIYRDLLEYFATRPDKMFVLIVSPPLRTADTDAANAANARAVANWLVDPNGWLADYSTGNVVAWDYFTVLTGGHHRVNNGVVEHFGSTSNYLKYPTGDSHPSAQGDQIATAEFVPFLNAAFRSWEASTGANLPSTSQRTCRLTAPWAGAYVLSRWTKTWRGSISPAQIDSGSVRLEIQHRYSSGWRLYATKTVSLRNGSTSWAVRFRLSHAGKYRLRVRHSDRDHRLAFSSYRYVTIK